VLEISILAADRSYREMPGSSTAKFLLDVRAQTPPFIEITPFRGLHG